MSNPWPVFDSVAVTCPWCGVATQSDLRSVKAHHENSRLDQCYHCQKDLIIEATPEGVIVSRGITVP